MLLAPFGGNAVKLALISQYRAADLMADISSLGRTESLQSISKICIH